MPSTRRTFLSTVGLTALAGCTSGPSNSTEAPSESPTAEPIPSPSVCDVSRPQPTATAEAVSPREYPEPPAELTIESAGEYAIAYERAYQVNDALERMWAGGLRDVDLTSTEVVVGTAYRGGILIGMEGMFTMAPRMDENMTRTPLPYGHGPEAAWYYLTDGFGLRKEERETGRIGEPYPDFDVYTVTYCR